MPWKAGFLPRLAAEVHRTELSGSGGGMIVQLEVLADESCDSGGELRPRSGKTSLLLNFEMSDGDVFRGVDIACLWPGCESLAIG